MSHKICIKNKRLTRKKYMTLDFRLLVEFNFNLIWCSRTFATISYFSREPLVRYQVPNAAVRMKLFAL